MKYLVDSSALIRIMRRQVDRSWVRLAMARDLAICEPVLCETLAAAGKGEYRRTEAVLLAGNEYVPVPDGTWNYVREMRRDLASRSMHNMFGVADYVIAATAIQLKLPLLHEVKDFVAAAAIFPQLSELRISAGPVPE
jgi:predicted nucleic acid-binding protein